MTLRDRPWHRMWVKFVLWTTVVKALRLGKWWTDLIRHRQSLWLFVITRFSGGTMPNEQWLQVYRSVGMGSRSNLSITRWLLGCRMCCVLVSVLGTWAMP